MLGGLATELCGLAGHSRNTTECYWSRETRSSEHTRLLTAWDSQGQRPPPAGPRTHVPAHPSSAPGHQGWLLGMEASPGTCLLAGMRIRRAGQGRETAAVHSSPYSPAHSGGLCSVEEPASKHTRGSGAPGVQLSQEREQACGQRKSQTPLLPREAILHLSQGMAGRFPERLGVDTTSVSIPAAPPQDPSLGWMSPPPPCLLPHLRPPPAHSPCSVSISWKRTQQIHKLHNSRAHSLKRCCPIAGTPPLEGADKPRDREERRPFPMGHRFCGSTLTPEKLDMPANPQSHELPHIVQVCAKKTIKFPEEWSYAKSLLKNIYLPDCKEENSEVILVLTTKNYILFLIIYTHILTHFWSLKSKMN